VIPDAMRSREWRRMELTAQLAALGERQATVTPSEVYRKLSAAHGLARRPRSTPSVGARHSADGARRAPGGHTTTHSALLHGLVGLNGVVPPGSTARLCTSWREPR